MSSNLIFSVTLLTLKFYLLMTSFLSLHSQRHAFHLVDPSVMPIVSAFAALTLTTGSVLFFHGFLFGFFTTLFGFITVVLCMGIW
jgi:hypothetical protein